MHSRYFVNRPASIFEKRANVKYMKFVNISVWPQSFHIHQQRKTTIPRFHLFVTWNIWIFSGQQKSRQIFLPWPLDFKPSFYKEFPGLVERREVNLWLKQGGMKLKHEIRMRWNDEMMGKHLWTWWLAELTKLDKLAKLMAYWRWGTSQFFFWMPLAWAVLGRGWRMQETVDLKLVMFADWDRWDFDFVRFEELEFKDFRWYPMQKVVFHMSGRNFVPPIFQRSENLKPHKTEENRRYRRLHAPKSRHGALFVVACVTTHLAELVESMRLDDTWFWCVMFCSNS